MAYIGKVNITGDWEKVEDLIKAQVEGQDSFAFDTSKSYPIQVDGGFGVYLCSASTTPTAPDEGEFLTDSERRIYKPESGKDLYIKIRGNSSGVKLSISDAVFLTC